MTSEFLQGAANHALPAETTYDPQRPPPPDTFPPMCFGKSFLLKYLTKNILSVIELPMLISITLFILQSKERKVSPSSTDCTVGHHDHVRSVTCPMGNRFHPVKLNGDWNFYRLPNSDPHQRLSYVIQNLSYCECNYHPLSLTNTFPWHAEFQLCGLFSLWHICFLSYKNPEEETADFKLRAHLFLLTLTLDRICGLLCWNWTRRFRQIFFLV